LKINLFPKAVALTIAGSDPSGGAGLQADLKTFQQLGVYGMSAITLITVQNTLAVEEIVVLDPRLTLAQIDAVVSDIPPSVGKLGALGNAGMVSAIAERAKQFTFPLIIDPVMISKHGQALIDDDGVEAIRSELLKFAYVVTPNRFEAEKLVGFELNSDDAVSKAIHDIHLMGAQHVLLKLGEENGMSVHILGNREQNFAISVPRLESNNIHGTGCALSASLAARIARGESIDKAANAAVGDVWKAIHSGHGLGAGSHPIEFRMVGTDDEIG